MLALSENHLQQLYKMSRAFIRAVQIHIPDFWTAHLKPRLGKRGEGYFSTAHQCLESLDRWQVVIATALVTFLLMQLLLALKDSLQSFHEKGELPPKLRRKEVETYLLHTDSRTRMRDNCSGYFNNLQMSFDTLEPSTRQTC